MKLPRSASTFNLEITTIFEEHLLITKCFNAQMLIQTNFVSGI